MVFNTYSLKDSTPFDFRVHGFLDLRFLENYRLSSPSHYPLCNPTPISIWMFNMKVNWIKIVLIDN